MTRILTSLSLLALLAACGDGQPFFDNTDLDNQDAEIADNADDTIGDGGDIDADSLLAGTDSPTDSGAIFRYETNKDNGGGLVTDVSYDAGTDTFTVDNIGFDGANVYQRGAAVDSLGVYAVFDANQTEADFLTGNPVGQIVPYRAVVGTSVNTVDAAPRTTFALVRTGGYVSYGFGGYVYERAGGVTLPTSGQATFAGEYGGVRTFAKQSGLRFVTGDMTLAIDFDDFNANNAIRGRVENRVVFFEDGSVDSAANNSDIGWIIVEGTDTLTSNGEIVSEVFTTRTGDSGQLETYFEGTFNGIIAGDTLSAGDGGEIVGIINMIAEDEDLEISIQETGGAILYR